jgi:hypothetical protein
MALKVKGIGQGRCQGNHKGPQVELVSAWASVLAVLTPSLREVLNLLNQKMVKEQKMPQARQAG